MEELKRNLFLIKEHTGMFKAANNYDIYDPETGGIVLECREENLGIFTKMFRFTKYKRMTPFDIDIKTVGGEVLVSIKRKFTIFVSKVEVFDESGKKIGGFKQKLFSIGGTFKVLDENDVEICILKGNWMSREFKFLENDVEYAKVSKKWNGVGKELFTTADNYMLEISDSVDENSPVRKLIMAAVMCIDMVLYE